MTKDLKTILQTTQMWDLVDTWGSRTIAVVPARYKVFVGGEIFAGFYLPSNEKLHIVPWGTQIYEDLPDEHFDLIAVNCHDRESYEELRLD